MTAGGFHKNGIPFTCKNEVLCYNITCICKKTKKFLRNYNGKKRNGNIKKDIPLCNRFLVDNGISYGI